MSSIILRSRDRRYASSYARSAAVLASTRRALDSFSSAPASSSSARVFCENESRRTVVVSRAFARSRRVASHLFLFPLLVLFVSLLRLLRHARRLRLEPESTANDVVVRRARHRARARPRRRVASVARRRRMARGRPHSGWCLDRLHICYSMKYCVLLWMMYIGTNESTRDRALTDRARPRDRFRTRARRDAHARAFTPARARVKTFPSVRRGGRAREREEW